MRATGRNALCARVKAYERLIWDLDGTLLVLDVDWPRLKQELAVAAGLAGGAADGATLTYLLRAAGRKGRMKRAVAVMERHELLGLRRGRPVEWAIHIFLANLGKSAILSNNMSATIEAFLRGWAPAKCRFVGRDMVVHPKPSMDGMKRLASFWKGRSTLLIGDSEIDRALAGKAGVDFAHVCARRTGSGIGKDLYT